MATSPKSSRALLRLLRTSATPIYVLDAERRIVFANAACAEWLGVEEDALIGVQCNYHDGAMDDSAAALAARLCPPPEVSAGAAGSSQVALPPASDERDRKVLFMPCAGEEGCSVLAVAYSEDQADSLPFPQVDATEARALHQRLIELRSEFGLDRSLDRLVGESLTIRRAREQMQVASAVPARVTLVGPAGCGAEALARAIHYGRPAPQGRLLPLACPLLDAELLQGTITELKRPAIYRDAATPGTLLLLEVDRLSPVAQDELAGFLMLPDFELHTLATSETPLLNLAAEGAFRRDLALALSTLEIVLAPLAERPEDVPLLAQQLLEAGNATGGRQFSGFTPEALDLLAAYHWPGDVDELAAMIQQARESADGPLIHPEDLPQRLHLAAQAGAYPPKQDEPIDLDRLLAEIEREVIHRALEQAKGNKSKAAELLGVTRARLHRRLAQEENGQQPKSPTEPDVPADLQPDFREIQDEE